MGPNPLEQLMSTLCKVKCETELSHIPSSSSHLIETLKSFYKDFHQDHFKVQTFYECVRDLDDYNTTEFIIDCCWNWECQLHEGSEFDAVTCLKCNIVDHELLHWIYSQLPEERGCLYRVKKYCYIKVAKPLLFYIQRCWQHEMNNDEFDNVTQANTTAIWTRMQQLCNSVAEDPAPSIRKWYFIFSIVSLALHNAMLVVFVTLNCIAFESRSLNMKNIDKAFGKWKWCFPILLFVPCIFVLPLAFIYWGFRIMFPTKKNWQKYEKTKSEFEWLKLFEQFGEAIPQVFIAITFYGENQQYVDSYDHILGLAIPTTLLSIIFSSVSIIMGFIQVIQVALPSSR